MVCPTCGYAHLSRSLQEAAKGRCVNCGTPFKQWPTGYNYDNGRWMLMLFGVACPILMLWFMPDFKSLTSRLLHAVPFVSAGIVLFISGRIWDKRWPRAGLLVPAVLAVVTGWLVFRVVLR